MALCLVVVAVAAELGGTTAALTACAIETYGVYCWVLVPAHAEIWMQSAAFLMTALLITYLIHLRNCAVQPGLTAESDDRSVTDAAPDVIVVIDEANHILSINPAVKAVFGYEPEELIGRPMAVLMPERLQAAYWSATARQAATGRKQIPCTGIQVPGVRYDGQEIPLEISFAAFTSEGHKRFTGFIRDISDRAAI